VKPATTISPHYSETLDHSSNINTMSDPNSDPTLSVVPAVGEPELRRLVALFYRQIPGDDILGPMYPAEALAAAEQRLAGFLIFRFGGPDTYIQERGHPRLKIRHAPFAITQPARDRWVTLMDKALAEVAWPPEIQSIVRPFLHDSATFLINRS
jgi:hemoglobin